ncbi:MAG TPA: protein-disulfide reductase DsbD [Burkholderiaceae bacterium]|nr:protein-disulfide reductase DsbD [Burkholderiaceae bacterium]
MNPLLHFGQRSLPTLAALLLATASAGAADFLDPAEAFKPSLSQDDRSTTTLRYDIAPRYHLYRQRFELRDAAGAAVEVQLPPGREILDEALGERLAIWEREVRIQLPTPTRPVEWRVTYQGCADEGLCYPPQHAKLWWQAEGGALKARLQVETGDAPLLAAQEPEVVVDKAAAESERITGALASGSLLTVMGVFIVFGLLLSFTPCVLPMLPILSSIIVGHSQPVSRARGFTLALSYSIGMALVYTAVGMLAGWLGQGLAGALQSPWVLGSFALLLAGLSLSMFGVWEFQMPSFIQERLTAGQNRMPGGKHASVFVMGALSALVVGPCVAAPLAGVLVYISQTRDLVLGGAALFSLACGMSVPLLLIGLSAGRLLPRTGVWMERVKTLFGVMLLATALWLVAPALPPAVTMLTLGAGVLAGAALLGWPAGRAPHPLTRALALPLALWGVALCIGALSGGRSLMQPLEHLSLRMIGSASAQAPAGPAFTRVRSEAELQQALSQSGGRPVLLDYYADWCVSCKEMEDMTFSDPAVRQRMRNALLLQADVTNDNAESRALLKRFGLFGPPGIIFLDAQGREADPKLRVIGFMAARDFETRLQRAGI